MDTVLQLGDYVFRDLEVPESLTLGGSQRLAVSDFVGGARNVQSLGADHAPIEWNGVFLGQQALDTAKYLDGKRVAGLPLVLTVFDSSYTVVIRTFRYVTQRYYMVPYQIALEVVSDDTQPVETIDPTDFDSAITADCSSLTQLGASIGNFSLSASIASLSSAVAAVPSFAAASTGTVNTVLGLAAGVGARAATLKAAAQSTINSVSSLGGVVPGAMLGASAAALQGQVLAATQYPLLQSVTNLAARVAKNVSNASLQSSTRTLQVAGGTLFGVAASEYGDPTQWAVIAKASGLTDPTIVGLQTLKIPANPAASGGVLAP